MLRRCRGFICVVPVLTPEEVSPARQDIMRPEGFFETTSELKCYGQFVSCAWGEGHGEAQRRE